MPRSLPEPIACGSIPITPTTAYVYRGFDQHDELLYIGVTDHLEQRLAAHRRESPWFLYARRIDWAQYPDRATAERVECRLIQELFPQHNKTGNQGLLIAAAMGHRRPYPTVAWKRLGEVIRQERARRRFTQKSVAGDGKIDIHVLREMEAGETTRYTAEQLGRLEYGMGWQHGSVEVVLQGGGPARLTPEQRMTRAHMEADRVDVMGSI